MTSVFSFVVAGAAAFSAPTLSARPLAVSARARPVVALDMSPLADMSPLHSIDSSTWHMAAQVFGLDTNPYGGVGAFSQTDSGASGDLNFVLLLGLGFPTAVTVYIYRDNIFAEPEEVEALFLEKLIPPVYELLHLR